MAELRVCTITEPWAGGWTAAGTAPAIGNVTGATLITGAITWQAASTGAVTLNTAVTQLAQVTISTGQALQMLNVAWPAAYRISPEEASAMLAAGRREAEERELARQVADARATQLLLSVLSADERESYTRRGFIEVQGSAGGWWRIRRGGQAGNVDELDGPGRDRIASWCCHPPDGLPDADAHLAQLLQLVTAEEDFRATGNRTPRQRLPSLVL